MHIPHRNTVFEHMIGETTARSLDIGVTSSNRTVEFSSTSMQLSFICCVFMTERSYRPSWFTTEKMNPWLYLSTEGHFLKENRSNIWLLRGTARDLIIDCGLGVCDLKKHLENLNLLSQDRECIVLCTHAHFDHCGGAYHFENENTICIHQDDYNGLRNGRQIETLNDVRSSDFFQQPYEGFSASQYRVPETKCNPFLDGHRFDLGGGDEVLTMHVPGHSPGSIVCYYPKEKALFTGDFMYECGHGAGLIDWLTTSSVDDYLKSANHMLDWLNEHDVDKIYPGHFQILDGKSRMRQILEEYIESRDTVAN